MEKVTDRNAASASLSADLELQRGDVFQSWQISQSHTVARRIIKQTHLFIYFHGQPLEDVQSVERLGFSISHDLSWADHIAKVFSKESHRVGLLYCSKFLLQKLDLLTVYKDFVTRSMEYCYICLCWILCNKALTMIERFHNEAQKQGVLLSHR